jgi:hypothetical protein
MRTVPVAWRKMGSRLMNEVVVCVLWNEAWLLMTEATVFVLLNMVTDWTSVATVINVSNRIAAVIWKVEISICFCIVVVCCSGQHHFGCSHWICVYMYVYVYFIWIVIPKPVPWLIASTRVIRIDREASLSLILLGYFFQSSNEHPLFWAAVLPNPFQTDF